MDGGEKVIFRSKTVSNQLPLDDEAGSLPCELCCLWTWRGLSDIGMREDATGQQVQPMYSRRCSGILRLSGPDQPKVLILRMVRV